MTDLWGFLLQTLTASGVAVLLLIIKALFRDKLPPRWQFSIWSILGLILLVPAGFGGRYVLLPWPWLVESAKSLLFGDYSLTHVLAPIPLVQLKIPAGAAEWLYLIYLSGVLFLAARYTITYICLRLALLRGTPVSENQITRIAEVAKQYGLSSCQAVEVPGLSSAFICGIFRPILALPAGVETDNKIILHELIHLKNKDMGWGLMICFFRCIHWCNPLLQYCADQAGNDLEARCDQQVLEMLEGEERRSYGRILLSMANERYARTPGTSSMANGGLNIRRRIEAIARFKKYPSGMELVSVCAAIILAVPLLLGTQPTTLRSDSTWGSDSHIPILMASARTLYCTTPAGALDAYAKSVLDQNGYYRAMCAPAAQQADIADSMMTRANEFPMWDTGLPAWPNTQSGYAVYHFDSDGENAYRGMLVIELNYPPDGQPAEEGKIYLAVQTLRIKQEKERWVVIPQEDFQTITTLRTSLIWGCEDLPFRYYEAQADDFTIRLEYQAIFTVDNYTPNNDWFFSSSTFSMTPQPHAKFTVRDYQILRVIYTGDPADKENFTHIGISYAALQEGEARPRLYVPGTENASADKGSWSLWSLEPGWKSDMQTGGGGSWNPDEFSMPEAFAADLYINEKKAAELTLLPVKGG